MWYACDVLYSVLYVRVNCFVVRGCAVSRRYINVCNSDVFSVVNMYLDHLKFAAHGGEVMYFGVFALEVNLVSLIVMIYACVL